jgi:large subunit ribosomal protein L22
MEVKASVKNIRISPRKVRLLASLVRGLGVGSALDQLQFSGKRAKLVVEKAIKSAIANATNTYDLDPENLFVKEIRVDEGATMKRWMPRARGRATPIMKRTSHLHLILGELVDSGEKKAKKQKVEAPISLTARAKEAEGVKLPKEGAKKDKEATDEKGKKIVDPRGEGKGKHTKIEGSSTKAFGSKMFRRKSG